MSPERGALRHWRPARRRRDPVVIEYKTTTRRHLALVGVAHTACGRHIQGMTKVPLPVNLPWVDRPDLLPQCQTCRRVLASGGLGFYVTRRGGILTHERIQELVLEAEHGYDVSALVPVSREPGPDAMRWYPNPLH